MRNLIISVFLCGCVPACGPGDRALECLDNLECGPGEACIDGECVLPECLEGSDCLEGESCLEYRCQLDVECTQDADCPQGTRCNIPTGACEPISKLFEGESCATDDECDQGAGLLCDSQVECYGCMLADPEFSPTFTCRYECDLNVGSCPVEDRACKYRHIGLIGLCIPYED